MPVRSPVVARLLRTSLVAALVPVLAAGAALLTKTNAHADGAEDDAAEQRERCAVRLSMALIGASPSSALLSSADPQSMVDNLVKSGEFNDRFASFINSEMSKTPGETAANDPVYALAKYVLAQNKPWTDLFVGPYALTATDTGIDVSADPNGVGYFRSDLWRRIYAGNDEQGAMLVAAFRIVQNTTGLTLVPSVGVAGEARDLNERKNPPCSGCHFEPWYALDKIATLLPTRQGKGDDMELIPASGDPVNLLGKSIKDDKELITTLVDSDGWRFNQCRRVFKFLYGRQENQCEAKVFDACVDALTTQKTIQAAVATVAKDPSFCTN